MTRNNENMNEIECLVSFVVPVFNGDVYLKRCLDSIWTQADSGIEIIVINDGSTDQTDKILKSCQKQGKRIKVIHHTQRRGPSISRIEGAKLACGEYIHFVDSDDMLEPTCYSSNLEVLKEQRFDIIEFNANIVKSNGEQEDGEFSEKCNRKSIATLKNGKVFQDFFCRKEHFSCIWAKWFKRSLVLEASRHIPEECFTRAEDFCFCTIASFFAKTKKVVPNYLYRYTSNTGISTTEDSTHPVNAYEKAASMLKILSIIKKFLQSHDVYNKYAAYFDYWEDIHLSGVFYLAFTQNKIKKKAIFSYLFSNYPWVPSLYLLAQHYLGREVEIAENLSSDLFPSVSKPIKTIGIYYYRLENGGVERVISWLTDLYLQLGYKVVILTDVPLGKQSYSIPSSVFKYTFSTGPLYASTGPLMPQRLKEWRHVLSTQQIDLVIYNAYVDAHLLWDLLTIRFEGVQILMYAHGLFSYLMHVRYPRWEIFKVFYRLSSGMICVSRVDAVWWNISGVNAKYMPNPLTVEKTATPIFKKKTKDIVWVGRISPEKQPVDAVKAFAIISKRIPDARLIFVGKAESGNPITDELDKEIRKEHLEKKVLFTGFTSDVEPFLKQAAIHILTSAFEGFGLVLLEAKAFAVPTVSYHLPNVEPLRNGKGSVCVDQGDYEGLAEEIINILEDPKRCECLALDAYSSLDYFTNYPRLKEWEKIIQALETGCPFNTEHLSIDNLSLIADFIFDGYKESHTSNRNRIDELEQLLSHEVQYYQKELKVFKNELTYYKRELGHAQKCKNDSTQNTQPTLPEETVLCRNRLHERELKYYQEKIKHLNSLLHGRHHHKIIKVATHFDDWTHHYFPAGSKVRWLSIYVWNFFQKFRKK